MKPKKNPKTDLNRNQGLYFVMGLAAVMALAYVALEWKSYEEPLDFANRMDTIDPLDEEVPIFTLKTPPPPQPPAAPDVIEVVEDDEPIEETVIETTEPDDDKPILDVDDIPEVIDDIQDEVSFIVIEDVPVFPGCESASDKRTCFQEMMQKHIRKHFRYPEIAQDMGIQGKVNTMFVIQKDGSIGSVRMRGPDKNLEKEAARILSKLPKMTPGKQRGRAVRVPFSIPITFKLQ